MDNIPLYLVGIMQHFLSSRLPTFGTKFGLNVVALSLVCYFRLKSALNENLSMKFVASSGVNVTLDVKISPTLCHALYSPQEFWKQVKRISKSSRGTSSDSADIIIDGCCNSAEISNYYIIIYFNRPINWCTGKGDTINVN